MEEDGHGVLRRRCPAPPRARRPGRRAARPPRAPPRRPSRTSASASAASGRPVTATRSPSSGRVPSRGRSGSARDDGVGLDAGLGGQRDEQRAGVGDAAGHRAGVVERRAERDAAVVGHAPVGRLDRADARERGRDPQRAGGVGAHRGGDHARRQRRGRAAARPAGRAVGGPRVADLVGRPARGELVRVAVAGEDHAVGAQAPPHRAVGGGDAALEHAARGRQAAGRRRRRGP